MFYELPTQEHALSSCLRTWRQAAEERRGAHRLRAKLLSAWQWQEASQAQQACFQAGRRYIGHELGLKPGESE